MLFDMVLDAVLVVGGGLLGYFIPRLRRTPEPLPPPVVKRIVAGVGVASNRSKRGARVEAAVTAAVKKAIEEGGVSVHDSAGLKRIMAAAREQALRE